MTHDRTALVRRGLRLNYLTIGYNVVEAIVALFAGVVAGSVALIGFGVDSIIELTASGAAQWRLRADDHVVQRKRVERLTLRIIGGTFVALALYVAYESIERLWLREAPGRSFLGTAILALSVVIMPVLARAKRHVAVQLGSRSLEADAKQTSLCAYLSAIALCGVGANALFGWWWADPAAALAMVPIIANEGLEALRGDHCDDCEA